MNSNNIDIIYNKLKNLMLDLDPSLEFTHTSKTTNCKTVNVSRNNISVVKIEVQENAVYIVFSYADDLTNDTHLLTDGNNQKLIKLLNPDDIQAKEVLQYLCETLNNIRYI